MYLLLSGYSFTDNLYSKRLGSDVFITIRERICKRERETLCDAAFLSENTKGRIHAIEFDDSRTDFQRDRDRIIHSKAFRRLMHKTQVFLCPDDDHYRTRLTHTLEVSQIARTIARSLMLNEDLCEAIALGHDLGHTPFGHAGERVLQRCFSKDFRHFNQSLRVVDVLEKLNLTYEVRDGILNHTGENKASTLEGLAVKFADRIAYINHDIDDAVRAGIMTENDIPKELREVLGETHSKRITTMITSIVEMGTTDGHLKMAPHIQEATDSLRDFLFKNVYTNPIAKGEESKAEKMLESLYHYFTDNPDELPPQYKEKIEEEGVGRKVCDFIADMTDRYAINMYKKLFIPEVWRGNGVFN